ncbi:hypothetical protein ACFL6U_25410 [Planctomycetota bacterium]
MGKIKDEMVRLIQKEAEQEAAILAGEFARAASEDKEAILAALEFEVWFSETCRISLEQTQV